MIVDRDCQDSAKFIGSYICWRAKSEEKIAIVGC